MEVRWERLLQPFNLTRGKPLPSDRKFIHEWQLSCSLKHHLTIINIKAGPQHEQKRDMEKLSLKPKKLKTDFKIMLLLRPGRWRNG